jgi:hypothetical protein
MTTFVVTDPRDPAPRDALYSVAEDAIELAVRPRATEPDSTTAPLEHDEPDGFAASGMARDAESGFPYRDEHEESTSVLGRVLTAVSSVASSGVAARYVPLPGTIGVEGAAPDDSLEEKWRALETLVPGLTRGTLLLGHVEHAGLGTAAKTSEPLPNCERATFSTSVDDQGRVTAAWVDSEMPLDAPERLEVQVPGSRGGETGAPESTAKLVFLRDAGAQVIIVMMMMMINNNHKKIQ